MPRVGLVEKSRGLIAKELPTGLVGNEEARTNLLDLVSMFKPDTVLDLSSGAGGPVYQLVGIDMADGSELEDSVRVTADRAKRSWVTIRTLIRASGAAFIILQDDKPALVLRRHPSFDSDISSDWLKHINIKQANRDQKAEVKPSKNINTMQETLRNHEHRIVELERLIRLKSGK